MCVTHVSNGFKHKHKHNCNTIDTKRNKHYVGQTKILLLPITSFTQPSEKSWLLLIVVYHVVYDR
jgi:hypothetical protein